MARVHRGVAVSGSPLRTELPHLEESGVPCFLTPAPGPWLSNFPILIYTFLSPSFKWTCLAGTLSTLKPFPPAADLGSRLYALSSLSLLCPGKEEPVQ